MLKPYNAGASVCSVKVRLGLAEKGLDSHHLAGDVYTLKRLFGDMQVALERTRWPTGDAYAMGDVAVLHYVDRLERFGMAGFWDERTPDVSVWLQSARARPGYAHAMDRYVSEEEALATCATGLQHWPAVKLRWEAFLA